MLPSTSWRKGPVGPGRSEPTFVKTWDLQEPTAVLAGTVVESTYHRRGVPFREGAGKTGGGYLRFLWLHVYTGGPCPGCGLVNPSHSSKNCAVYRCGSCGLVVNGGGKAGPAAAVKNLRERRRITRHVFVFQISAREVPVNALFRRYGWWWRNSCGA